MRKLALGVAAAAASGCVPYTSKSIDLLPEVVGVQVGYASWYGPRFHGRRTASGEIYDMNALTAAHKTLPFGTLVRVTNLQNGKSVVVRINDRGPYVKGRIIDLSAAAAKKIGLDKSGVAKVKLEIIGYEPVVKK